MILRSVDVSITLSILNKLGEVKRKQDAEKNVYLGYKEEYQDGDMIQIDLSTKNNYLMVKLDSAINESLIYVPGNQWKYPVITETFRTAYPPNLFKGDRHYLSVRYAMDQEVSQYRNVALNPHDQKESSEAFPHASANVETRDETTFYARNAIDGILANEYHGRFPYQSWGINQDPNAMLRIDFGRTVKINALGFILRGDYPHDSYWTQGTVTFSSGNEQIFVFNKLMEEQCFEIEEQEIEWLELHSLIKAKDESVFPALTQLSVYGKDKFTK